MPSISRAYRNGPSASIRDVERQRLKDGPTYRVSNRRRIAKMVARGHVEWFHVLKPSHRSLCSQTCIASTRRLSHCVRMCCTCIADKPGFQHERSRLFRNRAAHSSSAILLAVARLVLTCTCARCSAASALSCDPRRASIPAGAAAIACSRHSALQERRKGLGDWGTLAEEARLAGELAERLAELIRRESCRGSPPLGPMCSGADADSTA